MILSTFGFLFIACFVSGFATMPVPFVTQMHPAAQLYPASQFDLRPKPALDCKLTPVLCKAPFQCETNAPTRADEKRWEKMGLAADGHANLRYWCGEQSAANNIVQECLVNRDMIKSAHMVFDIQMKKGESELDASYCFLEGHCTNPQVTVNTTVEEAEHLCDERYGGRWRTWGSNASPPADQIKYALKTTANVTGYTSQAQTTPFVLAACAMGIYQCDVTYCKETYCKMEQYVKKYGHFLTKQGWSPNWN